jgi:hypothetical protein
MAFFQTFSIHAKSAQPAQIISSADGTGVSDAQESGSGDAAGARRRFPGFPVLTKHGNA